MKHIFLTAALLLSCCLPTLAETAADSRQDEESATPKFHIVPRARMLMDGALYLPDNNGFADGVAISDLRLGFKASYGDFSLLADIAYAFQKLGVRDVYMQWTPNSRNYLRFGYFIQPYGLVSGVGAAMRPNMIPATSESFFMGVNRHLGVMYHYSDPKFFTATSLIVSKESISEQANLQGRVSWGAMERFAWRPLHEEGLVAQVGISAAYQSPLYKTMKDEDGNTVKVPGSGHFDFSANFPTDVDRVGLLQSSVSRARGSFRMSPELILAKGRLALEGQYYYMNVWRAGGLHSYQAHGMFALLRGIVFGDNAWKYNSGNAVLDNPKPKSLECVLGYNYTNGSDSHAAIFGGISNDYSVTFNYFINKYMIARLRYSYTDVRNSDVVKRRHENIIQARIQFQF